MRYLARGTIGFFGGGKWGCGAWETDAAVSYRGRDGWKLSPSFLPLPTPHNPLPNMLVSAPHAEPGSHRRAMGRRREGEDRRSSLRNLRRGGALSGRAQ